MKSEMLKIRKLYPTGGSWEANRFSSLSEQNAFIADMHLLTKKRIEEAKQEDQNRTYDEVFHEVWHLHFLHWEYPT